LPIIASEEKRGKQKNKPFLLPQKRVRQKMYEKNKGLFKEKKSRTITYNNIVKS
jgi:hypothetical protein